MLALDRVVVGHHDSVAVRGVSLRVDEGEAVALIGSNGAGKTTLLRATCGLLPVLSGAVTLDGMPLHGTPAHGIARRGIAFVPAERHLFRGMSVRENLLLGAYPGRADPRRTALVLDVFPHLADRLRQLAGTLSGGEQQMLAVGRALMSAPRLLILDEPTTGLAPALARQAYAALAALRAEGLTVLVAEQQVPLVLDLADRAYVMEDGRIRLEGPAHELAGNPDVRRAYLGIA